MVAAALKQDVLLPQAPGGNGSGAALAVLVHAVLLAGLTLGVDWRTHSPEVVAAELWAAVPQSAAPAAPPPPPPPPPAPAVQSPAPAPPPAAEKTPAPPPPNIALEQERKRADEKKKADDKKAEDERKERERREKSEAAAKAAQAAQAAQAAKAEKAEKAEAERVARQREENLRRMMAQAGDTPPPNPGTGTAATNAAPSAAYAGRVKAAVRPNIVFTERLATNNAAEVEVTAAPGGSIISRKLVKSSGSAEWDDAVLRAIDKTRTLPRDTDGRVPASLLLVFRPNE